MFVPMSASPHPFADFLSDLQVRSPECYPHFLEQRFPHVLRRLNDFSAAADVDAFLDALLLPPQGSAQGFPEAALLDIRRLRELWLARPLPAEPLSLEPVPGESLPALEFVPSKPPPGQSAPGRDLRTALPLDDESFPYLLEDEFPQLLQEMLPLIGKPEFLSWLDQLLLPSQQARYGFSERAMLEILALKAAHRAHYPMVVETPAVATAAPKLDRPSEEQAAAVFDRVQRW